MSKNLWGELPSPDHSSHLRTILMEQGKFLRDATQGVLQTEISELNEFAIHGGIKFELGIEFDIVCPSFNNYSYRVFVVHYNLIHMYPCFIEEPGLTLPGHDMEGVMCEDQDSFVNGVGQVLSGSRVRTAVAALLREAKE